MIIMGIVDSKVLLHVSEIFRRCFSYKIPEAVNLGRWGLLIPFVMIDNTVLASKPQSYSIIFIATIQYL